MNQPANFTINGLPGQPNLPALPVNPALPTSDEIEVVVQYVEFFKRVRDSFPDVVIAAEIARWESYSISLIVSNSLGNTIAASLAPINALLTEIKADLKLITSGLAASTNNSRIAMNVQTSASRLS